MRSITPELAAALGQEVTTLATCWRIQRRDGVVLGFSTHDRTLTIDGLDYRAVAGFTPTAVDSSNALDVDNLDVEGVLESGTISRADLMAGRYDFAAVSIFLVNWSDLSQGKMRLRDGWLGEVTMKDGAFTAEVRGLTERLQADVGDVFSPECRADLGDRRCKVNLAGVIKTGTVTAVTDRQTFTDSSRGESDGWFDYGVLVWLDGANGGLETEVKAQTGGQFILFTAMPHDIQPGDRYCVHAGCDKRFETCRTKFDNALNFRGEPAVPGRDAVLDYPGVK